VNFQIAFHNHLNKAMPRFCQNCGVDAPNSGQCGEIAGTRHLFVEQGYSISFIL
jgi:hypothetical protein